MKITNTLKNILQSSFHILSLNKKQVEIIFVYLNHFNRNKDGSNPFLFPFINYCNKNNLKYLLIEETDLKGAFNSYPRNKDAIKLDIVTLIQILLRKIFKLKSNKYQDYHTRELKISKIIKSIFFRKLHTKNIILLAHNNAILWNEIFPNAKIFDYQHGMIWNGHGGTLENYIPDPIKTYNNIHTLVYGNGFKNLLLNFDKTKFYTEKNVIPIGHYQSIKQFINRKNTKNILYTIQNVDLDSYNEYYKSIKNILRKLKNLDKNKEYKIYIKNHPRCSEVDLFKDKNHIFITDSLPISKLIEKYDLSLHITSKSTTAFDFALESIPTIFIDKYEKRSPKEMFFNQYNYPLENFRITKSEEISSLITILEDEKYYSECSQEVYAWVNDFYQEFNYNLLQKVLNEK